MVSQPPFGTTGIDYLGPVTTKVAEETCHMSICLFTCLTTRAVHLEIITQCTAVEFLNCLIRFTSRRGTPHLIISDNAPQFRTTKGVLDRTWHQIFTDDLLTSHIANEGLQWRFTIELAPWQGGFYERLVGFVKITLKTAIGRRLLTWQQLVTLTAEVEAITNTRPITYLYGDIESRAAILRPIDFLTDLPVCRPNIDFSEIDVKGLGEMGKKRLVSYWKTRQKRMQSVWDVWYNEYLRSLRERGNSKHAKSRNSIEQLPKVNEIVLLGDADIPRGAWKLAKITKLIRSGDGVVRATEVLLPNKAIIRRAINFLYPLELDQPESETTHHPNPAPGEKPASASSERSDDDNEFDGFSQEEVDRVIDEMHRFDELSTTTPEATNLVTSIRRDRRRIADLACTLLSGLSKDPQPLTFPHQL